MQQSPVNRERPYAILVWCLHTPAAPDPYSAAVVPTSSSPGSYWSITAQLHLYLAPTCAPPTSSSPPPSPRRIRAPPLLPELHHWPLPIPRFGLPRSLPLARAHDRSRRRKRRLQREWRIKLGFVAMQGKQNMSTVGGATVSTINDGIVSGGLRLGDLGGKDVPRAQEIHGEGMNPGIQPRPPSQRCPRAHFGRRAKGSRRGLYLAQKHLLGAGARGGMAERRRRGGAQGFLRCYAARRGRSTGGAASRSKSGRGGTEDGGKEEK